MDDIILLPDATSYDELTIYLLFCELNNANDLNDKEGWESDT